MAKIYSVPKEIKKPKFDYNNLTRYLKDEEEYVHKVKEWCRKNSTDKDAGKEVKFQVADGYAVYIVFSLKPCRLIHLDIGDGWHYQYINRLTAKDIKQQINREESLNKLFGKTA